MKHRWFQCHWKSFSPCTIAIPNVMISIFIGDAKNLLSCSLEFAQDLSKWISQHIESLEHYLKMGPVFPVLKMTKEKILNTFPFTHRFWSSDNSANLCYIPVPLKFFQWEVFYRYFKILLVLFPIWQKYLSQWLVEFWKHQLLFSFNGF